MDRAEPEYRQLLAAARSNPDELTVRGALADWIQEHGDEEEAERVRRAAPVSLYSYATGCGTFTVTADWIGLLWPQPQPRLEYTLRNDRSPAFTSHFDSPYTAILSVSQHRVGLIEWDASTEAVPDYAPEWNRHTTENQNRRLLRTFLALRPDDSIRGLVDHFEQQRAPYLERLVLKRVLVQLMKTGEVTRLPSMWLAPAEMKSLTRKRKPRG